MPGDRVPGALLEAGLRFVERVRELSRALDQPLRIAELGIPEGDFQDRLEKLLDDTTNEPLIVTAVRRPSYPE